MRLVSYTLGQSGTSECYVTLISGSAGGLVGNVNRWLGQFGQPPKTEAEIIALPKVRVLELDTPLIETSGEATDMQGNKSGGTKAFIGVAWISEQGSMFVRMTGELGEVKAAREDFIAFCQSIHRQLAPV